jgi:Domain of unknown function (DUF4864)
MPGLRVRDIMMRPRVLMFLAVLVAAPMYALDSAWTIPSCRAADSGAAGPALRAADWTAIKKVIAEQRNALKAGDAAKAYSLASPGIRKQFGDAANFIDMVRTMYSALLTARYVEFLEGAVIDGAVIQPLRLIDADNTVRVALYIMERQENGTWRIGGCQLAPSTIQAT